MIYAKLDANGWPVELSDTNWKDSNKSFATSADLTAWINSHLAFKPVQQVGEMSVAELWSIEQQKAWTDATTGITLRQDEQTRSIATALLAASVEGIANGSLTGATQVQIRDATGVTRTGTVTQLRGLCYRYLTAWLSNYISKAP